MSHDSGFRRGGRDLTYKQERRTLSKNRASQRYEKKLTERFRDHESKIDEQPPDERDDQQT